MVTSESPRALPCFFLVRRGVVAADARAGVFDDVAVGVAATGVDFRAAAAAGVGAAALSAGAPLPVRGRNTWARASVASAASPIHTTRTNTGSQRGADIERLIVP